MENRVWGSEQTKMMILVRYLTGVLLTVNFMLFWATPIALQGVIWKNVFKPFLQPVYDAMDSSKSLRQFATDYIYAQPRYADYFATTLLLLATSFVSIGGVLYIQVGGFPIGLEAFPFRTMRGPLTSR